MTKFQFECFRLMLLITFLAWLLAGVPMPMTAKLYAYNAWNDISHLGTFW